MVGVTEDGYPPKESDTEVDTRKYSVPIKINMDNKVSPFQL